MMPQMQTIPVMKPSRESDSRRLTVFPNNRFDKAVSPALQVVAGPELPAYEMKFLVSDELAREIESRLSDVLEIDAHDDSAMGDGYQITTLYTDNHWLDVYYHEPPFRRHKYRLRRYGMEPHIFLERRSRWRDRVKKQRNTICAAELPRFAESIPAEDWAGTWFHRSLLEGNLHPVCRLSYHRMAYSSTIGERGMRLTFDRAVRGCLTDDWILEPFADGTPLLDGQVICEVKFCSVMPVVFKELVQDLRLQPIRISKYRAFMRISGLLHDKRINHA
jgi:hypothetical protein